MTSSWDGKVLINDEDDALDSEMHRAIEPKGTEESEAVSITKFHWSVARRLQTRLSTQPEVHKDFPRVEKFSIAP